MRHGTAPTLVPGHLPHPPPLPPVALLCDHPLLPTISSPFAHTAPLSWWPAALSAGMEVLRKVVGYSVGRPTRELLFTALPSEQVSAKVVVDGIVGRTGDVLAAGIFQVLGVWLRRGPRMVAVAGGLLSCFWLAVAGAAAAGFQRLVATRSGHGGLKA